MAALRLQHLCYCTVLDQPGVCAVLQLASTQKLSTQPSTGLPGSSRYNYVSRRDNSGVTRPGDAVELEETKNNNSKVVVEDARTGTASSWLSSLRFSTAELPKWISHLKDSSTGAMEKGKVVNMQVKEKLKKDASHLTEAINEKRLHMKKYEQHVKASLRTQDEVVNKEHHTFEKHIEQTNQGIASFYDTTRVVKRAGSPTNENANILQNAAETVKGKDEEADSNWQFLKRLPTSLGLGKPGPTEAKKVRPVIRQDFVSKSNVDRRTRGLVNNLKTASSQMSKLKRTEELCAHLLQYPDSRSVAYKEKALSCLLKLRNSEDQNLQAQAHEALALIGYTFPPRGRGIRLLTVDGGGTRGLVAIETLRMLELACKSELNKMFDYVVGTSTGALVVALIFLYRVPIAECEELYIDKSRQMFTQNKLRGSAKLIWEYGFHDSQRMEEILRTKMGEKLMIDFARDPMCPKMSAFSTLVNVSKWKGFMFRNYNLPPGVFSEYPGNCKQKIWEAVRASSAAPGFYKEFALGDFVHRDGGLLANNPTAQGIHECKLLWPDEKIQCVVSIGNGRFEPNLEISASKSGLKDITKSIVDSATDTEGVHMAMRDLLPRSTYFRFNPYLSEENLLDEIRQEKLDQMQQDARMYLRKNQSKLEKAAAQLRLGRLPHQKTADFVKEKMDSL